MTTQWYRADRAFDSFAAGQVVELDPDSDETHARWVNTGYLEQIDAPAGTADGGEPAVADQPTSTSSAAPAADDDQENAGGDVQGESGTRPNARSRRRS